MFSFTSLLGAQSDSAASQSLLELDGGVKILVDVGWDEAFDAEKLQALEKHISTLSVVLLTHPTIDHIGAYVHCCKHVPLFTKVPIYATTPVINLGRTLLADLYASSPLAISIIPTNSFASSSTASSVSAPQLLRPPPTADEITAYFNLIHPLKYSQPHQPVPSPFSPPLGNLTVTAYSAGHTLGGTIWHIQHSLESIVYSTDWHLARENLIPGAAWLGSGSEIVEPLRRPTALICSARGVERTEVLSRKQRDENLISAVRETIAQGGKVLIPTDSSARVLELAFLLNNTWRDNVNGADADTYRHAKIYMASKTSTSTVKQLQSMLEWMDDAIIRDVEAAMGQDRGDEKKVPTLLDWRHVTQLERMSQIERIARRSSPCVFLASNTSLESGFSRTVLQNLATDPRNLVILTDVVSGSRRAFPTVADQLADFWKSGSGQSSEASGARIVDAKGHTISLRQAVPEPLDHDETLLYEQYTARQQQLQSNLLGDNTTTDAAAQEIVDEQAEESSDDEDEDDDTQQQGRALNASAHMTQSNKRKAALSDAELGINVLVRSKDVHDFDVRNKRGRDKMFPFVAHRSKTDDFGEVIKPEDFLRAEERGDAEGVDVQTADKQTVPTIGQKRRWDDANADSKGKKHAKSEQNKKQKVGREPDDIDAVIARATGENGLNAANGAPSEETESDSDYEPEETASDLQAPQKVTFQTRSLSLQLRVTHIDFSGLHGKRDLQMIIPRVRPRKLILISGNISETRTLAEECRKLLSEAQESNSEVLVPSMGEMLDASVDTNAWTLKLSRQLVKRLTWQNVKGLGIVAITGRLGVESAEEAEAEDESIKKKLKLIKQEVGNEDSKPGIRLGIPVLDLVTSSASHAGALQRATQPVHVGDLRLSDLRRLLMAAGHTGDFAGDGTLIVDQTVIVRKSSTGRIEIESISAGLQRPQYRTQDMKGSFYAVRDIVYQGLAVVAGV